MRRNHESNVPNIAFSIFLSFLFKYTFYNIKKKNDYNVYPLTTAYLVTNKFSLV